MDGARTLAELGRPRARAAVIGEPTGLVPVMAHKGMMMDEIRLLGQSGHSSNPDLGINAMEAMHAVITDLISYREELKRNYQNPLFDIPFPTLNLGSIHGGDNPNRICGHAIYSLMCGSCRACTGRPTGRNRPTRAAQSEPAWHSV